MNEWPFASFLMPRWNARFLHDLFSRFDDLAAANGVHKIETIGCVAAAPYMLGLLKPPGALCVAPSNYNAQNKLDHLHEGYLF